MKEICLEFAKKMMYKKKKPQKSTVKKEKKKNKEFAVCTHGAVYSYIQAAKHRHMLLKNTFFNVQRQTDTQRA